MTTPWMKSHRDKLPEIAAKRREVGKGGGRSKAWTKERRRAHSEKMKPVLKAAFEKWKRDKEEARIKRIANAIRIAREVAENTKRRMKK